MVEAGSDAPERRARTRHAYVVTLCIGTPGFGGGGSLERVYSGFLVMRRHGRPDLRAGLGDTWYEEKRSYQKKIGDMPF